jgi:hypothetical protein
MLFASPRPVSFDPYGRRRKHGGVPRWAWLLLAGIAAGAGGVLFVEQRVLPPRLSAAESQHLRSAYESADAERARLQRELDTATQRLQSALAAQQQAGDALRESRQTVADLRADVGSLLAALPPDPRGGAVQVRAARLSRERGQLHYEVLLSRERAGAKPWNGVMQLVVSGHARKGGDTSVKLQPVAVSMSGFESLRGGLPLPEGFDAKQVAIHLLDRPDGKLQGMRVILVE